MSLLALVAALFAAPSPSRAAPRCAADEVTAVTFRAGAPPYSVEQGPCGAVILDPSDLPIYVLQNNPLRTLEVLP